ncbi:MAG TPA: hybrid sensor histidine kinase/response regulator [Vicinamibacterales bacterium]|nr:hybrid sensor histidine kinase/response regulator [Vicinamibacterales bacterium]
MSDVPSPPVRRPVTCLLVDDLEENLVALAALLRRDDVEVLTARSGVEALDLLLRHDVALAIVDVQMPEMDGFELAELMRGSERTRRVPLIFVTAGARDRHRVFKGYDAGAVDFLHKPIEPHVLANKAEVFFELYRHRRQLQEDLRARTETLRLNEMLAAVLGHDLRAPLSAILTGASLLEQRSTDPFVRDVVARIGSSGRRMNRMIADMLDFARARLAGGIPIARQGADAGRLVQRVVQEHQATFPQRTIVVEHAGDLSGRWDPDRIAQIASNLVGNALVHGDADAPVVVRLDGCRPDVVTLAVENEGTIERERLPRLFEPFGGVHQPVGHRNGLGLGLYIAQQIAQAHAGHIHVRSADGRTVFELHVPRG